MSVAARPALRAGHHRHGRRPDGDPVLRAVRGVGAARPGRLRQRPGRDARRRSSGWGSAGSWS